MGLNHHESRIVIASETGLPGGAWLWAKRQFVLLGLGLASIPSVIDSVFCPVNGILAFVLSVVRTTIRSIAYTIPAFFTEVLLVVNTIGGILHSVMSSLDASIDSGRKHSRRLRLLVCLLGQER